MIQPNELKRPRLIHLHAGETSTTTDVWSMLTASRDGDLATVQELVAHTPQLRTCQYDYTSPLQLAVCNGHLKLVQFFIEKGALDPSYTNHPFLEPLTTLAEDRELTAIAQLLREAIADAKLTHEWGDAGGIDYGLDEVQQRFQDAVDKNQLAEVEAMLQSQPELALNEDLFWGEGVLSMPAKGGDREMLELLMRFGATVPKLSKWGARYYFKHLETAAFLLEKGMPPNHMNWRRFTLLHDMAFKGFVDKARLLLDYGAEVNAIDDEYQSTPLGYAAHWGKQEMVQLLLERGADPNKAGASWAKPLAWATKKGHVHIAADLRRAGAQ